MKSRGLEEKPTDEGSVIEAFQQKELIFVWNKATSETVCY